MADDKVTIRVPKDAHEAAKQRKDDAGMTWAEWITDSQRGTPDADAVAEEITMRLNVDADDARDEIEDLAQRVESVHNHLESVDEATKYRGDTRIDEVYEAVKTIEDRLGRVEQTLEGLGGGR